MASTAVAERQPAHPIVALRGELEARSDEFRMALPAHITPEKFQRTVLTAVQQNPKLLKADRRSFLTACMKAAQDGLLPDGREAALVPFKTRMQIDGVWQDVLLVQYMPMVYGLRKKILQSGEVKDIFASVVYRQEIEAGVFIYEEGTQRMLRHKPLLSADFEPRDEDVVAAYSVATFEDGSLSFEVMRRADINKVRECSQTGALYDKKGQPREPSGPWVEWFPEQAKKSVIRRHSKTLPMSGDILDVEATDDALYARSTSTVLGSETPDRPELASPPPRRIAPPDDSLIDGMAEEMVERDVDQTKGKPARKKATTQGKKAPAETATPDNPAAAEGRDESDMGEAHSGADDAHPARKVADDIIRAAKLTGTIIDLTNLKGLRADDIAAMPDGIAKEVKDALDAAEARLKGGKQQ